MKKISFSVFLLLLLIPFFSRAQYFDWVERYTGSDIMTGSTNRIRQSVVDKDGSIYFVGSCAVDAGFHNNVFLPISPYGQNWNMACTVIGKISAEGDLVWSKVIYGNMSDHGGGLLQMLGDTAFALCTTIGIPRPHTSAAPPTLTEYLFYFDTLMTFLVNDSIVHNGSFLYSYADCSSLDATAYIVFNLDGEIIEQHWLTVSLLNQSGEPYNMSNRMENSSELSQYVQAYKLFGDGSLLCTDKNGNIYFSQQSRGDIAIFDSISGRKYIDINSPEVSGMRINIDGKRHIDMTLPDVRPSTGRHNYLILKFSPHFEELLASQFLFEPTLEHLDTINYQVVIKGLKCDSKNNIYLSGYSITDNPFQNSGDSVSLTIGGSDSLNLIFRCFDQRRGFFIKYDSALNPLYLKQLDRVTDDQPSFDDYYGDFMWPFDFDDKGKIVIFESSRANFDTVNTRYYYDTTEVSAFNCAMMRIDPDDGRLISKSRDIKSECMTAGGFSSGDIFDFAARNNRIIWQIMYRWWLDFAGERHEKQQAYEWGMGFAVWDYDGNELCFVDYGTNGGSRHTTSSVCLVDSVLYLTGMLASGGAQFGDVTVPNSGSSQSFIARYVDTAFMHPYVRPGSQQDIQLVVRDGEPVATVYPNPCAQRVTVDWSGDEPPLAATVTDITGRTYSVALTAAGAGQSDSEAKIAGRYTIDFSSLPAANYLLTITTTSGHRVTTRLLKR